MEQGSTPQRSERLWSLTICVAVSPAILAFALDVAAQVRVYRCTRPDGAVEFRQQVCADGVDGQEITIEDRKTGWVPPDAQGEGKSSEKAAQRKPKASGNEELAKVRREERCWKKRQLLDEVNWKLRRGYAVGEGVKLRRKRRSYEDYIDRYCD